MGLSNVRYNFQERWFWDMRSSSLEGLTLLPIQEPTELANFLPTLEQKLAATQFYPPLFEAAFGTPAITSDRIARALAQFLRALISYRSRFDEAYSVDLINEARLTPQEIRGRSVFTGSSPAICGKCHTMDIQVMIEPTSNGIDAVTTDPGVGGIGWFRAPSLRNIAVTAPYMHDGRFATLREVIEHYDHGIQDHQPLDPKLRDSPANGMRPIRLNLTSEDKDALEAFLHTLTDQAFLSDPRFADPFL